jgi:hypothetical protein
MILSEREQGHLDGELQANLRLLRYALSALTATTLKLEDTALREVGRFVLQRQETVQKLRRVCAEFGDNDWRDDDWLADVVDKHLYRHLTARGPIVGRGT